MKQVPSTQIKEKLADLKGTGFLKDGQTSNSVISLVTAKCHCGKDHSICVSRYPRSGAE